jgi:RNA polymerase sigma-70 factor, ECF subfamily
MNATMPRRTAVPEDELQWINQALQGDTLAFSALVEAYERPVYNLCYRMLGNAEDAEDASQETFLRAYRFLKRYDRSRPFSTWMLSIAAHYCFDQMRRRHYTTVSIEDMTLPDLPDISPGLETKLSLKEEQKQIQEMLQSLDPQDRAAVIMYYWYDFSYEEICQALSLSLSALKSRLHRARHAMARNWQEQHPDNHPSFKPERMIHETPTV